MAHRLNVPLLSVVLTMLLAACSDGERMRSDLQSLAQRNQTDSLLTDSALALRLVDYFDRHGTQNERLEAHYLLARTWDDLGQSPRALDAFHRAAEQADTNRLDSLGCHHLSRIYGQIGELLYNNQLPYNALDAYQYAYKYSLQCNEKLTAALSFSQKYKCYYDLNLHGRAEKAAIKAVQIFMETGDSLYANMTLGPLAYMEMQHEDFTHAKKHIELYEHHSFLSEKSLQNHEPWKLLYIYKGLYCQKTGQTDSALYYYYKALNTCHSLDNRLLAYKGLFQTYELRHQYDSVGKYAKLYVLHNDSSNRQNTSAALLSMHHLFDYNQMRNVAEKKTAEADRFRLFIQLLAALLLVAVLAAWSLVAYLRGRQRLKIQHINSKYVSDIFMYSKMKAELNEQNQQNIQRWEKAEEELENIKRHIRKSQTDGKSPDEWEVGDELLAMPLVSRLHHASMQASTMSDETWHELLSLADSFMPDYLEAIRSTGYKLKLVEEQICVLTKLRFMPSEISNLLGKTLSNISITRKRLLKKMFNMEGHASDLDEKLRLICCKKVEK